MLHIAITFTLKVCAGGLQSHVRGRALLFFAQPCLWRGPVGNITSLAPAHKARHCAARTLRLPRPTARRNNIPSESPDCSNAHTTPCPYYYQGV